jgi:hypothetical protein
MKHREEFDDVTRFVIVIPLGESDKSVGTGHREEVRRTGPLQGSDMRSIRGVKTRGMKRGPVSPMTERRLQDGLDEPLSGIERLRFEQRP